MRNNLRLTEQLFGYEVLRTLINDLRSDSGVKLIRNLFIFIRNERLFGRSYLAQENAFDLVILTLIIIHHTIATKSSQS